jgi:hypothetical protein
MPLKTGHPDMHNDLLRSVGEALRTRRRERGLSQPELARRLGRARARISELEVDLINGRVGRDRLALLAEACDELDLAPVLVPRERLGMILAQLQPGHATPAPSADRAFDDLFVDLSGEDD